MEKISRLTDALNVLQWEDIAKIIHLFRSVTAAEENDIPMKTVYERVLKQFKLAKYSEENVKDIIPEFLTIVSQKDRVRTNFNLNESQVRILDEINNNKKFLSIYKERVEGVSSVLAAFCAIRAYFKKTEIFYINPTGALNQIARNRIIDFLEQLNSHLNLLSGESSMYLEKSPNAIRLSNGSAIYFRLQDNFHNFVRGHRADYVIIDEISFIKNALDTINAAKVAMADDGKIVTTETVREQHYESF